MALELVRATFAAGGERPVVDGRMAGMLAVRARYVAQALEIDALAVARRNADGHPLSASLTEFGSHVGERLAAGDVALMPGRGGIRLVSPPKCIRRPFGKALEASVAEGPFSILATAPDHYDEDVVEGSATSVMIDALASWTDHPAARIRRHDVVAVRRAWEVYSIEGASYGLVLETAEWFLGLDAHGGHSCETSLAGAAWQVRVNC